MMMLGLALLAAGFALQFLVGRRRFLRRNVAGIEQYGSYLSLLFNRAFNRLAALAAALLLAAGLVLIAADFFPGVHQVLSRLTGGLL
ncbi:hypothetical protein [Xanthomonas arboricola]|uniref:hypothetical protein n=1 Tax=Xanthomonas arboricola TaxID=56448 RepID=UPI0003A2B52B|nr:hypothetical protein [Xanthomonas arboricola]BCT99951.1 hypothetical protein [uncultured bacterium]